MNRLTLKSCFFDVGANVGFYTAFAAELCNEGTVHAFEIDPVLACELNGNVNLNKLDNVQVICAAVWSSDGHLLTFGPHQMENRSTNQIVPGRKNKGFYIPSMRLDSYCTAAGTHPDVLKIDVEGAEVRILQGLGKLINRVRTIFIEVHPTLLNGYGDSLEGLDDMLSSAGLTIWRVTDHRGEYSGLHRVRNGRLSTIDENCVLLCER